jgi:hypothetical protein
MLLPTTCTLQNYPSGALTHTRTPNLYCCAAWLRASADCVIAVANIDSAGYLTPSSNFGAAVRIAAPGADIVSTWPVFGSGNVWQTMSSSGGQHDAAVWMQLLTLTRLEATEISIVQSAVWCTSLPVHLRYPLFSSSAALQPLHLVHHSC